MEYDIKLLREIPFIAPVLAHWAYENWYSDSGIDYRAVISDYSRRINHNRPPMTAVAVMKNNFPVGMVSLKKSDLQSRRDLFPWMSALYVLPQFRKNGIGENLINYLLNFCSASGISRVHLFIDRRNEDYLVNFYSLRGWKLFSEAVDHDNSAVKIFSYDLA